MFLDAEPSGTAILSILNLGEASVSHVALTCLHIAMIFLHFPSKAPDF